MIPELVFVDEHVPGVRWDAKYATCDNFTGGRVDGYVANRIVGTTALYAALAHAQILAATRGFGLLLWDAYRPARAVASFLRAGRRRRRTTARGPDTTRASRDIDWSSSAT